MLRPHPLEGADLLPLSHHARPWPSGVRTATGGGMAVRLTLESGVREVRVGAVRGELGGVGRGTGEAMGEEGGEAAGPTGGHAATQPTDTRGGPPAGLTLPGGWMRPLAPGVQERGILLDRLPVLVVQEVEVGMTEGAEAGAGGGEDIPVQGRSQGWPESPSQGPSGGWPESASQGPSGDWPESPSQGASQGPPENPPQGTPQGPPENPPQGPPSGPTHGPPHGPLPPTHEISPAREAPSPRVLRTTAYLPPDLSEARAARLLASLGRGLAGRVLLRHRRGEDAEEQAAAGESTGSGPASAPPFPALSSPNAPLLERVSQALRLLDDAPFDALPELDEGGPPAGPITSFGPGADPEAPPLPILGGVRHGSLLRLPAEHRAEVALGSLCGGRWALAWSLLEAMLREAASAAHGGTAPSGRRPGMAAGTGAGVEADSEEHPALPSPPSPPALLLVAARWALWTGMVERLRPWGPTLDRAVEAVIRGAVPVAKGVVPGVRSGIETGAMPVSAPVAAPGVTPEMAPRKAPGVPPRIAPVAAPRSGPGRGDPSADLPAAFPSTSALLRHFAEAVEPLGVEGWVDAIRAGADEVEAAQQGVETSRGAQGTEGSKVAAQKPGVAPDVAPDTPPDTPPTAVPPAPPADAPTPAPDPEAPPRPPTRRALPMLGTRGAVVEPPSGSSAAPSPGSGTPTPSVRLASPPGSEPDAPPAPRPRSARLPPLGAFASPEHPSVLAHRTVHAARLVRAAVEGLLGVEPDAAYGRVRLAPDLPAVARQGAPPALLQVPGMPPPYDPDPTPVGDRGQGGEDPPRDQQDAGAPEPAPPEAREPAYDATREPTPEPPPELAFHLAGLRVGDARIDLDCRFSGGHGTLRACQTAGRVPLNVVFQPLLPFREVVRVHLRDDEAQADVTITPEGGGTRLGFKFPLDPEARISVDGSA